MRGELAAIEAPTLVITGEYDFICGPACAEDIAAGVRGSEKVVLEDCGHFTFVEKPDEFCATIDEVPRVIDRAVDAIQRGKTVILPTDTVYGLAASRVLLGGGAQHLPAQATAGHAADRDPRRPTSTCSSSSFPRSAGGPA